MKKPDKNKAKAMRVLRARLFELEESKKMQSALQLESMVEAVSEVKEFEPITFHKTD